MVTRQWDSINSRNFPTSWATVSFTRYTVLHGISYIWIQHWLQITVYVAFLTHTNVFHKRIVSNFLTLTVLNVIISTRDVGCSFPCIPLPRKIYSSELLRMFPSRSRRCQIISEDGCVLVFCKILPVLRRVIFCGHVSWNNSWELAQVEFLSARNEAGAQCWTGNSRASQNSLE